MILCKIMNNNEDEVPNLLAAKLAVKYKGTEIDAMKVYDQPILLGTNKNNLGNLHCLSKS